MTSDNSKPFNEWLDIKQEHFFTSKQASAGTTLLTQAPLASVPQPSERHHRCNYCLRKGNLQRCSRCHSAYFCSNECFLKAWIHFHRGCCEEHKEDHGVPSNTDQWLLERAVLTLHSHKSLNTSPIHLSIDAFDSLDAGHTNMNKQKNDTVVESTFDKLSPFFNKTEAAFTKEYLHSIYQRAEMSRFIIQDPDMHLESIGVGLFPITRKYIPHSCRPNAGLFYYQGHQLLVALQDIPENTPITITYIDMLETKAERQRLLKVKFNNDEYQCHCSRCEGEFNGLDILLEREQETTDKTQIKADLSEQLKSWSVLEMTKEYATKDHQLPTSLDMPHITHFVGRLIAPAIYIPIMTGHHKKGNNKSVTHYHPYHFHTSKQDYEFNDEKLKDIIQTLLKIKSLPYFSLPAIRAAQELLEERINEGNWVEASRCTIFLFMVYRLVYPSLLYPEMVYHNLMLARASWNSLVQLELAGIGKKLERIYQNGIRIWIETARKSILLTFGQESSLWREIIEIQWLFERDQKLK
ncbi:hypothetical protein K501DRAFT_326290 [Backusella circina FSU 941]|nr:hypothetical protein K501DRAFT_326290 [Backusella circina FSU 941]